MRALEFKTRIEQDKIIIPSSIREKLYVDSKKTVRVIVLIDDREEYEEDLNFRKAAVSDFLEGYSESDSIYDDE